MTQPGTYKKQIRDFVSRLQPGEAKSVLIEALELIMDPNTDIETEGEHESTAAKLEMAIDAATEE